MAVSSLQPVTSARYRLARHYWDKLRAASRSYERGYENAVHALTLFERKWPSGQQSNVAKCWI